MSIITSKCFLNFKCEFHNFRRAQLFDKFDVIIGVQRKKQTDVRFLFEQILSSAQISAVTFLTRLFKPFKDFPCLRMLLTLRKGTLGDNMQMWQRKLHDKQDASFHMLKFTKIP